jgi:hypothetical protein
MRNNHKQQVNVRGIAGTFAEDKDLARQIRLEKILPSIENGHRVELDFTGVLVATQSFVHAIISEALRIHGQRALELVEFKGCNPTVKSVILTVVEYSLEDKLVP